MQGIEYYVVCVGESGYSMGPLGWRVAWVSVPGGNWNGVALDGFLWPSALSFPPSRTSMTATGPSVQASAGSPWKYHWEVGRKLLRRWKIIKLPVNTGLAAPKDPAAWLLVQLVLMFLVWLTRVGRSGAGEEQAVLAPCG